MIYQTREELVRLTGYKRPADQIRFLERNGIPYLVNARGEPIVRRDMGQHLPEPELGPVP